jgi:hypothetical protein
MYINGARKANTIPDVIDQRIVGCRNALNINPNIFLSHFYNIFIILFSDILQTYTKYHPEFFQIFYYCTRPENLLFRSYYYQVALWYVLT